MLYGSVVSRGSGQLISVNYFDTIGFQMDSWDLQEIHQALQSHKEHVHYNKTSTFNVVSKLHDLEEKISS